MQTSYGFSGLLYFSKTNTNSHATLLQPCNLTTRAEARVGGNSCRQSFRATRTSSWMLECIVKYFKAHPMPTQTPRRPLGEGKVKGGGKGRPSASSAQQSTGGAKWITKFEDKGKTRLLCRDHSSAGCSFPDCKFEHLCPVPRPDGPLPGQASCSAQGATLTRAYFRC